MRLEATMICTLGLVVTLNAGTSHAASLDDFVDFSGVLPGRMYIPPEASASDDTRPLILYLHGGLSAGRDNRRHITDGGMDELLATAKDRGAYLYAPQSPTGWNNGGWRSATEVMTMINQAISHEKIDPNRLYVTGLSMGGGGTWDMLNQVDDRFAAAMPISTDIIRSGLDAANFLDTPIWAFHARDDTIAPVSGIQKIINDMLVEAEQPELTFPPRSDKNNFEYVSETIPLRYTEWAHGQGRWNHIIWPAIWSNEEIMDWLFAQSRSSLQGDLNGDGTLDVDDLDTLTIMVQAGSLDTTYDLDGSGTVDLADRQYWVTDIKNTWIGDSNLDGAFDSGDLVAVFTAGRYEDDLAQNSTWSTGDWNGDREFDSGDLVAAFTDGGYDAGPRAAVSAVPEPSSAILLGLTMIGVGRLRKRR